MPRREPLTEPPAPALAELTALQREQAMGRFAVLRPHLEQNVPLSRSAIAAGVPVRTAERWLARYRLGGLVRLARAPRADLGRGKAAAEVIETIEGLYLRKPRPSVATIRRRLLKVGKERHWTVPSYASIYRIIRRLDPGMVTLAHEGHAAYRDQFELLHRFRAEKPNAIWQADHTQLDLHILDAGRRPARPWLTTIIDDHSRALAGYSVFLGAPSTLQTSLALRQAIWRKADPRWPVCGTPDVRADFGLILIGMPGIEKRMARYPQFYSRVGFAHHFHPLQGKDLSFVTAHHCRKVCSGAGAGTPNAKAIATIARITGGNFRLLHRLLVQIERVLKINKLTAITVDVIDAARSMLVIGAT